MTPLQFGGNVRVPAIVQVTMLLLGTLLLVIVYGKGAKPPPSDEIRWFGRQRMNWERP